MFLGSIFNAADVTKLNRRTIDVRDHQVVKLARVGKSSEGSQCQLFFAGGYISTRHISILTFESLPDEDLAEEPFGSYQVTEEVSFERGLILSVSSEGNR